MRKIKVLHLIKTLRLGGAERNLFNLIRAMNQDGCEIHVGYSYGGELENSFKNSGAKLFKVSEREHKVKSFATFFIILRLVCYILKNKIEIIHTHVFTAHIWGLIASKLTRRILVEHVHDFRYLDPLEFKRRHGQNLQYRYGVYLKNLSDAIIVLTRQNRRFIASAQIASKERIFEIKNGLPLRDQGIPGTNEARRILGLETDSFVVLTAARISIEKNIGLIMRIAPAVLRKCPKALFLILGAGPLLEEYQRQCRANRLQNEVRFLGFHSNIPPFLSAADLFLLPSFLELHSISILEAMERKVPLVISKDVGCHNEFIKSWENGILCDPFDDKEWIHAIITLGSYPKLRRNLAEAAYETLKENFDIKETTKKMGELYAELVRQ